VIDPPEARRLRAELVAGLMRDDASLSAGWREAFERVPRHAFVPRIHQPGGADVVDESRPETWLAEVYRDLALVTLVDERDGVTATSSSSAPGVMWAMLDAIDVRPGQAVLEIGTGTGYNAALLCERLGAAGVTTIDVDADLVAAARARLALLGYRPTVAVVDGVHGYPPGAPYDRVLATCAVRRVPYAWIEQTRTGGLVCAVLPYGLVLLRVAPDGTAVGRFHPAHFTFMEMRGGGLPPVPLPVAELFALARGAGPARPTAVPGAGMPLRSAMWMLVMILELPGLAVLDLGDGAYGFVDHESRSWARVTGDQVVEGGRRRLWAAVEDVYGRWHEAGEPERPDIGLSVGRCGQRLWLRSPDSGAAWWLPRSPLRAD
jgi:protein-L-isoaspartate O-methyltransferase